MVKKFGLFIQDNRRLIANIAVSFVVKGGAVFVTLLITPAYFRYFQVQEVLGVWYTIISILNWILSLDLGIGNGLRNKLTASLEREETFEAKSYVSSAYFLAIFIAIVVSAIGGMLIHKLNLNSIMNIPTTIVSRETLQFSVNVVFFGVTLQLVLKLITSVLYAMQRAALNSFIPLLSNIIILLYVLLSRNSDTQTNMMKLSIVNVAAINVPLIIVTIAVFTGPLKNCAPSIKMFNKDFAISVMAVGATFLALQFAAMLIGSTNEMLISKLTSPANVVQYQVYFRLFNTGSSIVNLGLVPIWSAVTQAMARKEYSWILKIHTILLRIALIAFVCMLLLIPFMQKIVDIWLGRSTIQLNVLYCLCFCVVTGLTIWNGSNCTIANGLTWLKAQSIFLVIGAIINIPISILLMKFMENWIAVVIANAISLLPICIVQPIYLRNKLKHKVDKSC